MSTQRAGWVIATLVATMVGLVWPALASAQASGGAVRPLPEGHVHPVTSFLLSSMDPLPHEARPNEWPQPDYFNEALKLTRFSPGAKSKALKLTSAPPELLVLPLQTQVFGWTPGFNAVVGAMLDSHLALRNLDANRQTDLFDVEGPFVRRFDDADIAAFAQQYPNAPVLALYLGRDAAGKSVVTLTLRTGSQQRRAHRAVDESPDPSTALNAIDVVFPLMLDELGVGARTGGQSVRAKGCEATEWQLPDHVPTDQRSARACQALILGVLLPEFEWPGTYTARPRTPAKLAWLAQAYSEAAYVFEPKAAEAMRAIVWSQLELGGTLDPLARLVDLDDPVIRPLARLLWAPERNQRSPVRSGYQASVDYVASTAEALPEFARAAYIERLRVYDQFRRVDLCGMELLVPAMRIPAECAGLSQKPLMRTERATRAERTLLQEWRLARGYKDVHIQGVERGDPAARQRVLDSLPAWIAAHPFMGYKRFTTANLDSGIGEYKEQVQRTRAAVEEFVQSTADQQRYGRTLNDNAVSYGRGLTNTALRADPEIARLIKDEDRMIAVLDLDGFESMQIGLIKVAESGRRSFLRAGEMLTVRPAPQFVSGSATQDLRAGGPAAIASAPMASAPIAAAPKAFTLFDPAARNQSGDPMALEQKIAADPMDMRPRVQLALTRLKEGQPIAQVRAVIDARAEDKRTEYRIGESQVWSRPALMLLFAGELEAAGHYYERVVRLGTGSGSELVAREVLALLAGDIPGATVSARERLRRYEGDYARRDLAGLEFVSGHNEQAWAALTPRLALSESVALWTSALVGQRHQGLSVKQVREWLARSDYGHAKIEGVDIGLIYLSRYAMDDRVPTSDDVAQLADIGSQSPELGAHVAARAMLQQLAFADRIEPQSMNAIQDQIHRSSWVRRPSLKPLYAWVVGRSGVKNDPSLQTLDGATLESDFDGLLAKAILLGLAGNPTEAVRYLRAARVELGYLGLGTPSMDDEMRSAPHTLALVDYLLYNQTRDVAYRDEALRVAQTYQRIFPFLGWTYALSAALSPDKAVRTLSACRAVFLDPESQFLKLSGLKPVLGAGTCQRPLFARG